MGLLENFLRGIFSFSGSQTFYVSSGRGRWRTYLVWLNRKLLSMLSQALALLAWRTWVEPVRAARTFLRFFFSGHKPCLSTPLPNVTESYRSQDLGIILSGPHPLTYFPPLTSQGALAKSSSPVAANTTIELLLMRLEDTAHVLLRCHLFLGPSLWQYMKALLQFDFSDNFSSRFCYFPHFSSCHQASPQVCPHGTAVSQCILQKCSLILLTGIIWARFLGDACTLR